jgi:hypothetical protein
MGVMMTRVKIWNGGRDSPRGKLVARRGTNGPIKGRGIYFQTC